MAVSPNLSRKALQNRAAGEFEAPPLQLNSNKQAEKSFSCAIQVIGGVRTDGMFGGMDDS